MILRAVEIKNYRSIKELTLNFHNSCIILVGSNESGKTNILNALSLLKPEIKPTINDVRDAAPEENDTESYVRFIFSFEKEELDEIWSTFSKLFYGDIEKQQLITLNATEYSLKYFCTIRSEGIYSIDIAKGAKAYKYWSLQIPYKLNDNIKIVNNVPAKSMTAVALDGTEVKLTDYKYVNVTSLKEFDGSILTDATAIDLNLEIGSILKQIVERKHPKTIIWEYSDKNLLPGRIDLAQFRANPEICIPLKNMFAMAGYENITQSISDAETKKNGIRNLLNKVATVTTQHINSVWKERKDIKISLAQNGPSIEAGIQDTYNFYDFSRRSEGFKRFVTFLLMVSVEERNQKLTNSLILIDEPDLGLHPSGIKNLREELFKISTNNKVVISTHSINMIDKENIDRHKIVKKDSEITEIIDINKSEITDEEVIYNALGFSLYEILKENNLVFEGWRDKEFFRRGVTKFKLQDSFKDLGVCHAAGVKDVEAKAGLIELFGRKFKIISDSDKVAKEQKENRDIRIAGLSIQIY